MEVGECLVCFNACKTTRKDIDPCFCGCTYFLHKKCYLNWKKTGTERVCLICDILIPNDIEFYEPPIQINRYKRIEFIFFLYAVIITFLFIHRFYSTTNEFTLRSEL